ncbi:MAG: amidohydrolase [Fibrobacter sp.]|nr:amidohydrolase [Fibrobacter sp.]
MAKIVLKSVYFNGSTQDILIKNKFYSKVNRPLTAKDYENAQIIDCSGLALLPAFYNGHCHAAMTLMRGYADDMPLHQWLNDYIWPLESRLTPKDIEIGSRLAILEMIKSGTVFFADMYWNREHTIKAVNEMGIRATIGVTISDMLTSEEGLKKNFEFLEGHKLESDRIKLAVMPHSTYTVSEKIFRKCVKLAHEEGYVLHTHLSETRKEVLDCQKNFGRTPVELMEKFGALGKDFVAAHCVHLTSKDFDLLANSHSHVVLNLCSNLKLSSGIPKIKTMLDKKINIALGTDGASSNNNLDMHEEMKLASLLAKAQGKADTLKAEDALAMASLATANAYQLKAGIIAEDYLADGLLIDMNNERMTPGYQVVSDWVYSADSRAIHSVICNGKFVMQNHHVDGEEEIIAEAKKCVEKYKKPLKSRDSNYDL